jgi:tripartite-type tricarboxylate transporter receptor subunit TctC
VPVAVGIHPSIPAKNIQEFIALAKATPDKFTWGAEGVGAVGHLTMERLMREGGFKILVVHYKGTSPALLDLLAGRVSAMVTPVPNLIEQFRGGKVRPVAVTTKTRLSTLPDVPTLEESGFKDFEIGSWYGLWGPAGMPTDVVATLNRGIAEAMKTPSVTERVAKQGLIPVGSSSADFAKFQNDEIAKFSKIIKDADIKIGN